jgi:hypothetical protein
MASRRSPPHQAFASATPTNIKIKANAKKPKIVF